VRTIAREDGVDEFFITSEIDTFFARGRPVIPVDGNE
jgi:hypothetical protein